jgi:hypothetical protein
MRGKHAQDLCVTAGAPFYLLLPEMYKVLEAFLVRVVQCFSASEVNTSSEREEEFRDEWLKRLPKQLTNA